MKLTYLSIGIASFLGVQGSYVGYEKSFSVEKREEPFIEQLYGDLLKPRLESPINSFSTFTSDIEVAEGEDPEFQAQCGFYNEHPANIPSDDYMQDLFYFAGIVTFAHLPAAKCFTEDDIDADIVVLGAPFDTATTYRPGARFGPNGIRQGGRRLGAGPSPARGFPGSKLRFLNPYNCSFKIVDCGDIPMTPFDNRVALNQLYRGHRKIHSRQSAKDPENPPRIITLGGDHTITLMALRSAFEKFGPLAVIHFDSHIDSWSPKVLGGNISKRAGLNHGTFLHYAHEKGYLANDSSIHVGIRGPFHDLKDEKHDFECGFQKIISRDIDIIGIRGIIQQIKTRVGDLPVYISLDIDVLDIASAPGTGTPEPGGFTAREILTILDGLEGLNIVGADVVEVAPAYDSNGDVTAITAASVVDSFLGIMTVE